MQVNINLPLFGYMVECKRKDLEEDNLFYIKVNHYSEGDALDEVRNYLINNFTDCEVVKVVSVYKIPFAGIIN